MRSKLRKAYHLVPVPVRQALSPLAKSMSKSLRQARNIVINLPITPARLAPILNPKTAKELFKTAHKMRINLDLNGALETAYKGLAIDAELALGSETIAEIYTDLGRHDLARAYAQNALNIRPVSMRAVRALRSVGGAYVPSISIIDQYLSRPDAKGIDFVEAVQLTNDISHFPETLRIADQALERLDSRTTPVQMAEIVMQKAFALECLGEWKKAIAIYDMIPVGTKIKGKAASGHARCLLEIGMMDQAREVLAAVGAFPGGPSQRNHVLQAIHYLNDNIGTAHLIYRHRPTSVHVETEFGQPATPSLNILSPDNSKKRATIFAEGGPGDEIRLASMYPQLRRLFSGLTITCEPRLESILMRSFPDISFLPVKRHRKEFAPDHLEDRIGIRNRGLMSFVNDAAAQAARSSDMVFTTLDALGELRTRRSDFGDGARLSPRNDLVNHWRQHIDGRQNIAISWRSMLRSSSRNIHYLDPTDLAPLGSLEDITFWCAQTAVEPERLNHKDRLVFMALRAAA